MNRYLKNHLGAKLLISYLMVILVAFLVIALASQGILPTAFNRHMQGMAAGMMMGGPSGPGMMDDLFSDFRNSFNEALLVSGLAAAMVAVALSVFLSTRLIAPLRDMMRASGRIAEGHYEQRVRVQSTDELGQLALRFNQMAERLGQVELLRQRLIGDVSHELRTPLTAIKGSMEGLIDGVIPATPETFQELHAEAGRLGRLVDDLQELSRVEAGAYELEIRPVEILVLTQTVAGRVANQLKARRIVLDIDLTLNLPRVLADEDRALQVLTNLVTNAIYYSKEGGQVRISASHIGDEVQFLVEDEGIGIPAEHLPHIFDRFYRVDRSRSRAAGAGSGIGLTIAKHFVEALGGRIWAESAGELKGSTFQFTLPAET